MKRTKWFALGLLALAVLARAGVIVYNANLVDETALAYNNTYVLNLTKLGITSLSAQAVYSSATVPTATFADGSQSVGSLTVANYQALVAARATNHLTVTTNSGLKRATVVLPGYVFTEGLDWKQLSTPTLTAASIASALAKVPYLAVHQSGTVIYATTTANGSNYNSVSLSVSTPALTVAHAFFTGGQNNATVSVNGTTLLQGRDFTAATSNAATATSLVSAINASAGLNIYLHAVAASNVANMTSLLNGALYNFTLQSSSPTALTASGVRMTGGTTPAFTKGSALFSKASSLTLALPVLYTGSPAIGGLTSGATYYAVPAGTDKFELSKYSTSAVAGVDLVVVTSTNTGLTPNTYSLAPLAISGTPSFKWQVSNDGTIWDDLAVSSVTVSSYSNPPATTIWSFGFIGLNFIRLNVVAPTTGGLKLRVTTIGAN